MPKYSLASLGLVLMLGSIVCASQTNDKQVIAHQYSVEAEVYFRPWETKEFGKLIGSESLIVMTSPNEKGDIVVLRKDEASGGFTAEVYRPDTDDENPDIWTLTFPEEKKVIVRQPDDSFQLSERVEGKDGGRRFEVFRLNKPAQSP